jgi:hypothetical protein
MTRRTIRTVMQRHHLSEAEAEQRVAGKTPAKRILPAEEIAETVARIGSGEMAAARGYPLIYEPS